MNYKLQASGGVQRLTDGAFIPPVPGNRDWDAYLNWLATGNTPVPADDMAMPMAIMNKMVAVDAWYNQQIAAGITITPGPDTSSITLAATFDDQSRHTSMGAMQHLALDLGQVQLTDETGLADYSGAWQSMTVQQLFALLLQYGAQLVALSQTAAGYRAQINAAATVADVDAITIN
jgi:hypothetical protein